MSGVDVMAVLDVYCQRAGNDPTADVVKVRDAVAELIEAATDARGAFLPCGNAVAPHARLTAALARCRGGES